MGLFPKEGVEIIHLGDSESSYREGAQARSHGEGEAERAMKSLLPNRGRAPMFMATLKLNLTDEQGEAAANTIFQGHGKTKKEAANNCLSNALLSLTDWLEGYALGMPVQGDPQNSGKSGLTDADKTAGIRRVALKEYKEAELVTPFPSMPRGGHLLRIYNTLKSSPKMQIQRVVVVAVGTGSKGGGDDAKPLLKRFTCALEVPQLGLKSRVIGNSKLEVEKACAMNAMQQLNLEVEDHDQMQPATINIEPDALSRATEILATWQRQQEEGKERVGGGEAEASERWQHEGEEGEGRKEGKGAKRNGDAMQEADGIWTPTAEDVRRRDASFAARVDAYRQRRAVQRENEPEFSEIRAEKAKLPVNMFQDKIVKGLASSRVMVLQGDTGSGKTTQIPQLILERAEREGVGSSVSIIVTEPRRVAAVSAAQRVADERREPVGESVGYHVRLDRRKTRHTRGCIEFCTTGVLLMKMQQQGAGNDHHDNYDGNLRTVTHIIVDEAHERGVDIDCLLALLRQSLDSNPNLRVIIMSATLQAELFYNYFKEHQPVMLQVPGKLHPVDIHYPMDIAELLQGHLSIDERTRLRMLSGLRNRAPPNVAEAQVLRAPEAAFPRSTPEMQSLYDAQHMEGENGHQHLSYDLDLNGDQMDMQLIASVIKGISAKFAAADGGSGAILVFLPSWESIDLLRRELLANPDPMTATPADYKEGELKLYVLPLHSMLASSEQKLVFESPPVGCRKVILSTNLAETSLTIPDVTHVVDLGRAKEVYQDSTSGVAAMHEIFISQSNAAQRCGRAGRTQPGNCYRLYSEDELIRAPVHPVPEIARIPLTELVLRVAGYKRKSNLNKMKARTANAPAPEVASPSASLAQTSDEEDATTSKNPPGESCGSTPDTGPGSIERFLQTMINPPRASATALAISELEEIGALDLDENLTPLGSALAQIPAPPRIGKMIVMGRMFGVSDEVASIAAIECDRTPLILPIDPDLRQQAKEAHKKLLLKGLASTCDFLYSLNLLRSWTAVRRKSSEPHFGETSDPLSSWESKGRNAEYMQQEARKELEAWARDHFISLRRLAGIDKIRHQLRWSVTNMNLPALVEHGTESLFDNETDPIVHSAVCGALMPQLARTEVETRGTDINMDSQTRIVAKKKISLIHEYQKVHIHRSSVLSKRQWHETKQSHVLFKEKTASSDMRCVFIRKCTIIPPITLALLSPEFKVEVSDQATSAIASGVRLRGTPETLALVQGLRNAFNQISNKWLTAPESVTVQDRTLLSVILTVFKDSASLNHHAADGEDKVLALSFYLKALQSSQ